MITKIIKVGLASLLVFCVAAPAIIGVYDATNLRTNGTAETALGEIVSKSELQGRGEYLYESSSATGISSGCIQQSNTELSNTTETAEANTLSDWYNCNPDISDSLATGKLSLIYEFSDGSLIDFGSPYDLYWDTESLPPDYYDAVVAHEDTQTSLFAPEKAYAGPLSWVGNKLKMLVAKSGYWKSANAAFYSVCITACMSTGMSPIAAQQFVDKIVQRIPPIVQMFNKEGVVATEETGLMVIMDATLVASRTGQSPAQIPALINQSATSVMNTGTLLSGSSANFMNAWYQILATNQVSASFLMSNADFFTHLFSFLGADLTSFSDIPGTDAVASSGVLSYNGVDYSIKFMPYTEMLMGKPLTGAFAGYTPMFRDTNVNDSSRISAYGIDAIGNLEYAKFQLESSNFMYVSFKSGKAPSYLHYNGSGWQCSESFSASFSARHGCFDYGLTYYNPDVTWSVFDGETQIGTFANGSFTGDAVWVSNQTPSSDGFTGEIIGADAKFDENGNIIDYGNVNVPNITAPGYTQPGTFADALDQLGATATIDKPAQSGSPSQGGGTVGDWVEANKPVPKPPSDESSQDDFKVQDLEKVFPFSIPWDIYYLLAAFSANPIAPNFTWHFDFALIGTHDFAVDLAQFNSVAGVFRACETVLFCVGLALITRNLIRG